MNSDVAEVDFRAVFEARPVLSLVLMPDLTIVAVSDAFLQATGTDRRAIVGKQLFSVLQENPDGLEVTDKNYLPASLNIVLSERLPLTMAVQRYRVQVQGVSSRNSEEYYWSLVNTPVLDSAGEVIYIILVAADTATKELLAHTQQMRARSDELEKLNLLLETGRDEAIQASNMKSAFVATISHELRTPLSGVTGLLELALFTDLTAQQRELLKTAHESAEALLVIVNDILDLSRIEAGKPNLEIVPFNAIFLIQDVARLLVELARKKGLVLSTCVDHGIPQFVIGEPTRLRQVLLNLIGNAIKFTERGEVALKAAVENRNEHEVTVRFSVTDTGIGISEEDRRFLFKPFSQVDNSNTRRFGGTGLGLAISHRLVDLMGGEIRVESQPGTGSTFSFDIPFQLEVHPQSRFEITPSPANRQLDGCCLPTAKLVLIVEDDPVLRMLTVKQLIKLGVQSQCVSNGQQAIEAVQAIGFDLILMDCHMPNMNGFEATKIIRELELANDRHIPIIAMTAGAMAGDKDGCLAAGMDDYLSKPFALQELGEKLSQWLPLGERYPSKPPAP